MQAHRPDESRQGLVPALGPGSAPGCREGGPSRACTMSFRPHPTDYSQALCFRRCPFSSHTKRQLIRAKLSLCPTSEQNKCTRVHVFVSPGEKNPKPLPRVFKKMKSVFFLLSRPKKKKKSQSCIPRALPKAVFSVQKAQHAGVKPRTACN